MSMAKRLAAGTSAAVMVAAFTFGSAPAWAASDEAWTEIRDLLFDDREILDGDGVIQLQAPIKAPDAALVPIEIAMTLPAGDARYIENIHLVIDNNPAPIAGTFHLSPDTGTATIATRVRVDDYTYIRAIAETNDGGLYMAKSYVKAAGGCSVPSGLSDHSQAIASLGDMKLKPMTPFRAGEPNEMKLLIRHPNYSGFQRDQMTRDFIPPNYIHEIKVTYGDQTLLSIDGDISLSENPSIRFSFVPQEPAEMAVEVRDTDGGEFEYQRWVGPRPGA